MTSQRLNNHQLTTLNDFKLTYNLPQIPGNLFVCLDFPDAQPTWYLENLKQDACRIETDSQDLRLIRVNPFRPLPERNLALAHCLGHYYVHPDLDFTDDKASILHPYLRHEKEATAFAIELLYPEDCRTQDQMLLKEHNLLHFDQTRALAQLINDLSHRYCLPYEFTLAILLADKDRTKYRRQLMQNIKMILHQEVWEFDPEFYRFNH